VGKNFAFGNFSGDINGAHLDPHIEVDMWHPAVGYRCRICLGHSTELKVQAIPFN